MVVMSEDVDYPGLTSPGDYGRTVASIALVDENFRWVRAYHLATNKTIVGPWEFVVSNPGTYTVDLPPTSELTPAGVIYERRLKGPLFEYIDYFSVPNSGGPYDIIDNLTDPPASLLSSALATHQADLSAHGGGQELAIAQKANNSTTTSTTYVDVPELTLASFTMPARPVVVMAQVLAITEELNQGGDFALANSANLVLAESFIPKNGPTGQGRTIQLFTRLPNLVYAPASGTSVTIKLRYKTSVATSDLQVFCNFVNPIEDTFIRAFTA